MTRLLPRLSGADRTEFLAAARSLVGTPFQDHGRTARGVDCVGLCVYALGQIDVQCNDLAGYSLRPDGTTLQAKVEEHLGPPTDHWRPGDVVLMRWYENRRSRVIYHNHVGLLGLAPYGNRWTLIHALKEAGRVIEHGLDDPWSRRVSAVYSLAGEQ